MRAASARKGRFPSRGFWGSPAVRLKQVGTWPGCNAGGAPNSGAFMKKNTDLQSRNGHLFHPHRILAGKLRITGGSIGSLQDMRGHILPFLLAIHSL